jgi:hypothetical protein
MRRPRHALQNLQRSRGGGGSTLLQTTLPRVPHLMHLPPLHVKPGPVHARSALQQIWFSCPHRRLHLPCTLVKWSKQPSPATLDVFKHCMACWHRSLCPQGSCVPGHLAFPNKGDEHPQTCKTTSHTVALQKDGSPKYWSTWG